MNDEEITIIDVARDKGLELDREVAWSVGAAIRGHYEMLYGRLPPKKLRKKTSGTGSHCFAVYPAHFRSLIERLIASHEPKPDPQMDFDF